MSPETLHIVVHVHVDGDQILGQVGDGITDPKPFTGWLGLIGALDGLIRVAAEGDTPGVGAPAPVLPGAPLLPTIPHGSPAPCPEPT